MNTITHALIPLIAAGICERSYRPEEERCGNLSVNMIIMIAVFGAAPVLSLARRNLIPPHMIAWLSGAYLLHIFCDAVSGGVAWSYPFGRSVVGAYYVEPIWWIPLDVSLFLIAYGLFRVVPKMRRPHRKNAS